MDGRGGFGLQDAGLTADECFAQWLLGLPREAMLQVHLKLCRLTLRRRQTYIEYWRYAVLVSLQRFTALPQVVENLAAVQSSAFNFTAVAGQMVEFLAANEFDAWEQIKFAIAQHLVEH